MRLLETQALSLFVQFVLTRYPIDWLSNSYLKKFIGTILSSEKSIFFGRICDTSRKKNRNILRY